MTMTASEVNDKYSLTQYLKDAQGLVAVMVAIKTDEGVRFGYAKYARNKEDKPFTRKRGRGIAIGRALGEHKKRNIPFIIKDNLDDFIDRCNRYFRMDCAF